MEASSATGGGGDENNTLNIDCLDDISKAVVFAQYGKFEELCQLYNENRVEINQKDKEGCTILQWASINNRIDIARFLIGKGVFVNEKGGLLGETSLQWAVRHGYLQMVILLMESGADLSHRNNMGLDALFLAVQCGKTEVVFYLLASGSNPDTTDTKGFTPLMWVCSYLPTHIALIWVLLAYGAGSSINQQLPENGNTALHFAVMSGVSFKGILALVEAGASFEIENTAGQTPLTLTDHEGYQYTSQQWLQRMTGSRSNKDLPLYRGFFLSFFQMGGLVAPITFLGWKLGSATSLLLMFAQSNLCTKIWMTPGNLGSLGLNCALITFICGCFLFEMAPSISIIGTLLHISFVSGILWFLFKAHRSDPGSPQGSSLGERSATVIRLAKEGTLEASEMCATCVIPKTARLHHCTECHKCIERFDHHCPWIGNCVGIGTHRYFVGFLICVVLALISHLWHSMIHLRTACEPDESYSELARCLFIKMSKPFTFSCIFSIFVLWWVVGLLVINIWQIGIDKTTYEVISNSKHYQCRHANRSQPPARVNSCLQRFVQCQHSVSIFSKNVYHFAIGLAEPGKLTKHQKSLNSIVFEPSEESLLPANKSEV